MRKSPLKPITMAASLALLACGCSHGPQGGAAGHAAAAQSAAKSPANASAMAGAASGSATGVAATPAAAPRPAAFELSGQYVPCNDFYGYVNAKWIATHPIPADHAEWNSFTEAQQKTLAQQRVIIEAAARDADHDKPGSIEQKLGWLYAAGMDTAAIDKAGLDPIRGQLDAIAGLTRAGLPGFLDEQFNEGNSYVFEFSNDADFRNAELQIGYVEQAGLGLPTPAYYSQARYAPVRKAYLAYIAKSLELSGLSAADAVHEAREAMTLETALAKASLSPTALRNLDNQYHFVSVAQADAVSPHFNWKKFFAAQGVSVRKGFSLSQPKFIAEFDRLLVHAPLAQWQAYLRFHAIDAAAPYLSRSFEQNRFAFYGKTLQGQPEERPRWQRVLGTMNDAMGMALGRLYVAKYFPPAAKARAETLVANVHQALKARIEHLAWMSAATKAKALEKLSLFVSKIGYPDPDEWRDWRGLTIVPGHYFADEEAAAKFNYHWQIDKIGKKTDRREWQMTPQTINAYYDPLTNTINFPAAILQPPFFFANGDDALNYGGIGAVIGHESTHAFDDQGSQFNGEGDRKNWWTRQDRARFEARTKRLVEQFDAYAPIAGQPKLHINGQLTLGENIADLGGLNISYDALQTVLRKDPALAAEKIQGFTEDQRFFLSFARVWRGSERTKFAELMLNTDPHAPPAIRAIAAPSNMPQFAAAFQCKAGDRMVRPANERAQIW
ncbi:MAG: M13 family metallopeptidase [Steroidobacteraceae bacterium]